MADPKLHHVGVEYFPVETDSRSDDEVAALLEQNYANGPFISSPEADRAIERLRGDLIQGPVIRVTSGETPEKDPHREVFDD